MDNRDILFASLVGSRIAKQIPRLSVVQNELGKHALPGIPFLPNRNEITIATGAQEPFDNLWRADAPFPIDKQFFPLSFSIDDGNTWFLLPYETMINISGRNNIIRRSVAKWKAQEGQKNRIGTIKERWSQDDYEINITGVLIGSMISGNVEDCFPREDFEKLRKVLTHAKEIKVSSPPLEYLGISNIVIEDFTFPFTKGENVQAYTIRAYSDESYNLILT
jgi:hypothetical protein